MKFMNKYKNKINNIIRAMLLSFIVVIISLVTKCIYYYQPDDYLMNYISRGTFGNGSDSYLVFINIIIGKTLSFFYKLFPQINWFGIIYIVTVTFIFGSLIYLILELKKNKFSLIFVVVLEYGTMLFLSFTMLAYMAMGVFFCYVIYMLNVKEKIETEKMFLSVMLIIIGSGFRVGSNVLLSSMAIFIPVFVLSRTNWRKVKWHLLSLLLIYVIIQLFNTLAYQKDTFWNNYQSYNVARSLIVDNTAISYDEKKEQLNELGISENDLKCINQWIFADKHTYSLEKLNKLGSINQFSEKYICNPFEIIVRMLDVKYNWIFLFLVLLLYVYADSNRRLGVIAITLNTYVLVGLLFFRNRPVERVMIPLYFTGIMAIIIYVFEDVFERKRKTAKIAMSTFLVVILISFMGRARSNYQYQKMVEQKYSETWDYIQNNEEYLYIGSAATLNEMLGFSAIWEVGEDFSLKNVMKLGTWDIYSSRYYSQVEKYNVSDKDSLLISMAIDENIIYIVNDNSVSQNDIIENFIEEHTGREVSMDMVNKIESSGMQFYRVILDN